MDSKKLTKMGLAWAVVVLVSLYIFQYIVNEKIENPQERYNLWAQFWLFFAAFSGAYVYLIDEKLLTKSKGRKNGRSP